MDDKFITRAEHEEYSKRMEDEHRRQNHRINEVELQCKENNRLLVTVEKLAMCMDGMQKEQKLQREQLEKQNDELEELKSQDGRAWKNMKDKLIGAFLGAIGAAAAAAFIYAIAQFI